jgi:hypothetical protein
VVSSYKAANRTDLTYLKIDNRAYKTAYIIDIPDLDIVLSCRYKGLIKMSKTLEYSSAL